MEGLLVVGLIAACCGVPVLVAVGASMFRRKPVQGPDAFASLENGRSRADGLPNLTPEARLEDIKQAGRDP